MDINVLRLFNNAISLSFSSMTSYRYRDDSDDNLLDRNQNITRQPEAIKITRVYDSDGEQDQERSSAFRGRSQSLKHLNERVETEPISRSKSLRDVDTGDFESVKARVSYVDSWNPVNPVGRGRIAKRIQSWENLDADEGTMSRSIENGTDRRNISTSNSIRTQSYEDYTRSTSASRNWRDGRYEAYEAYTQESAQYSYGYDRDSDNQVR